EDALNADLKKLANLNLARTKEIKAKEDDLKAKKGNEAELQKEIAALQQAIKDSGEEKTKIEAAQKRLDVKSFENAWAEKEAYAADGYRLLTSRKLCAQCHQIGNIAPSEKDKQGPPLALAHQRL